MERTYELADCIPKKIVEEIRRNGKEDYGQHVYRVAKRGIISEIEFMGSYEESWLIVRIGNETLFKILNDDITVLSAFKDKKIIVASRRFGENASYRMEEYDEIEPGELPASDQYLEMKEHLSDYINKIGQVSCIEMTGDSI